MILHFKNGESYRLENRVIALLRTKYYAEKDKIEENTEDWENLFNESIDYREVDDWFENNVNFEDIKDSLVKVETKKVSLEYLFENRLFEYII